MSKTPRKSKNQPPSVSDIEKVVGAKQQDFVERLAAFRTELEQLIQLMGSHAINSDIAQEVQRLATIAGLKSEGNSSDLSDARITTEEKIEFIVSELKQSGGSMEKTDLLERAREKFGRDRPASFLDPALSDYSLFALEQSREKGNQKTVRFSGSEQ